MEIAATDAAGHKRAPHQADELDPRVEALVTELIGRVADKWTMILLEVFEEHGQQRFTQIARKVPEISQKMLTQTLRRMERDGMITRHVHAVVPPRVDYALTPLGSSLGEAFCGVWVWAAANLANVEQAREVFDAR
jgi:DNA-binding HxlR family transcriptional regulator